MQSDVSSRELTLIRSDQGAGDVELDRIFMMHCVTHNIPIGTSWRIPLHFHLKQLPETEQEMLYLFNFHFKNTKRPK